MIQDTTSSRSYNIINPDGSNTIYNFGFIDSTSCLMTGGYLYDTTSLSALQPFGQTIDASSGIIQGITGQYLTDTTSYSNLIIRDYTSLLNSNITTRFLNQLHGLVQYEFVTYIDPNFTHQDMISLGFAQVVIDCTSCLKYQYPS